ncbi:MAG: hypothetical protein HY072_02310 [Deltaproteobacteria bacterium]|nr:hypothetical protein [Deltaproteobacteria bacterium]
MGFISISKSRLNWSESEWRFLWRWLFVSLGFHLLTAYFSVGYHSPDEHFQIVEFAGYKLGLTPLKDLAIEFSERMRPWMLPAICTGIANFLQIIGIQNPFTWALCFRLFASLMGWLSCVVLTLCLQEWIPNSKRTRRTAILVLLLIWFLPVLHARPSSENLAGSSFLIGLGLMVLNRSLSVWLGVLAGIFLGLSFEFRFQMGFAVAGLVAWWVFQRKSIVASVLGFLFIFALGRMVDAWGYGEWVFSPWRYIDYNLIRNQVSIYGSAPWWDIFRMSFTESWPFLGTMLLCSVLLAWIRFPTHILTWSYVPLFLIHEWIAHKELRFFFPIAMAAPVLFVMSFSRQGLQHGQVGGPLPWTKSKVVRGVWKFLLLNNFLALIVLTFMPFSRIVQFYEGVYKEIQSNTEVVTGKRDFDLYTLDGDPYNVLGTQIGFYRPAQLRVHMVKQLPESPVFGGGFWFFSNHFELPPGKWKQRCELRFQTLPSWIKVFGSWLDRVNVWSLYRCRATLNRE